MSQVRKAAIYIVVALTAALLVSLSATTTTASFTDTKEGEAVVTIRYDELVDQEPDNEPDNFIANNELLENPAYEEGLVTEEDDDNPVTEEDFSDEENNLPDESEDETLEGEVGDLKSEENESTPPESD